MDFIDRQLYRQFMLLLFFAPFDGAQGANFAFGDTSIYSRFQVNEVRASGHGSASAPTINDIICTSPTGNLLYSRGQGNAHWCQLQIKIASVQASPALE